MGNKKKKKRKGFLNTSSLFKYARIAAFVAPAAGTLMRPYSMEDNIKHVVWQYTGYNIDHHFFDAGKLAEGWLPYIVTSLLTHGVQKLTGIIRRL